MTIAEELHQEEDFDYVEGCASVISWTENGEKLFTFKDGSQLIYAESKL